MAKYKRRLRWGQSPFDAMTKKELLHEVRRMYGAIIASYSVMGMASGVDSNHPYWGSDGSGGRALEMLRQIHDDVEPNDRIAEDVYKCFYRYANDLLFDRSAGYRIGFGWAVCPKCGRMWGDSYLSGGGKVSNVGSICRDMHNGTLDQCDGVLRPLAWSDLDPKKDPEMEGRET